MSGIDLLITLAVIIKVIDIIVHRTKKKRAMHQVREARKDFSLGKILFGAFLAIILLGGINGVVKTLTGRTGATAKEPSIPQAKVDSHENIIQKLLIAPTTKVMTQEIEKIGESLQQHTQKSDTKEFKTETAIDPTVGFKAQYKKPEHCYNITDNETRISCANHYIRARKAFEQAKLAWQS
ncbi:MAG: hypothetical protein M8364_18410 [Methylobacter sp.]|uniref:hypothetical protein n=1 Tax=Methylobacter sp. TaxID=2051955 RepID=UPI00258AEF8B|nr:hypothetical protein [Methylobacter sp.]MCL7422867.1 hypothetical protein [Methylobacter sp.]